MEVVKPTQKSTNKAVDIIKRGGVIVSPTDTVYGFLADATNKKAVRKIYKIKKRAKSKPLPVFVKNFKMAKELAEIGKEQEKILKKYWPGRYTFIFRRKKGIKIYGVDKTTIALRIPKYKFLNDLLKKINRPLAQTSVNISGKDPLELPEEMVKRFGKYDLLFVDASNLPKRKPSAIIDLAEDKIKILRK